MSALLERLRKDEAQFISALELIELIAEKNNIPKHKAAELLIRALDCAPNADRVQAFGLNPGSLRKITDVQIFPQRNFKAILYTHAEESTWWEYDIPF